MIDTIYSYILDHFPIIGLIIGLIVSTTFITVQVIRLLERLKKVEKNSLEAEHKIIPRFERKLDKICDTLIGFKVSFAGLVSYLSAKDVALDASLYIIQSPVKLSELGIRLLSEYRGKEFVDLNIDSLLMTLQERKLATALDVENQSIITILELSETICFSEIKNYLYYHPAYTIRDTQYAFPLATLARIMGIYLRDIYLEKNGVAFNFNQGFSKSEQTDLVDGIGQS